MVVNKNFKWKRKTGRYQNGESLYLNRICVGSCDWNNMRSKGDTEPNHYVGRINLPALKSNEVYGDEQEEVKAEVEKIVNAWFNEALRI